MGAKQTLSCLPNLTTTGAAQRPDDALDVECYGSRRRVVKRESRFLERTHSLEAANAEMVVSHMLVGPRACSPAENQS